MNRYILIAVFLMLQILETNAQIPNGGFEEWEDSVNYFKPALWWTNQNSMYTRFERDTMAMEGHYALKAIPSATSSWDGCSGLAIKRVKFDSSLPENSVLTFFVKCIPEDPDKDSSVYLLITGFAWHQDSVVGGFGWRTEAPVDHFERIEVPLAYAGIDEISIFIYGGASSNPTDGPCLGRSYAWIDDMRIDTKTALHPPPVRQNDCFKVYPNPSGGVVHIESADRKPPGFELYTVYGELADKGKISNKQLSIQQQGIYILRLFSEPDHQNVCSYKVVVVE